MLKADWCHHYGITVFNKSWHTARTLNRQILDYSVTKQVPRLSLQLSLLLDKNININIGINLSKDPVI